jgi:hypothetical protein
MRDLAYETNGDLCDAFSSAALGDSAPAESEDHEVEALREKRKTRGRFVEYFVKWKRFGEESNSWEPRSELLVSASEMVKEFDKKAKADAKLAQENLDQFMLEANKSEYERNVRDKRIERNQQFFRETFSADNPTVDSPQASNATSTNHASGAAMQALSAVTEPLPLSVVTEPLPSFSSVATELATQSTSATPVMCSQITITRNRHGKRTTTSPAQNSPPVQPTRRRGRSAGPALGEPRLLQAGDCVLSVFNVAGGGEVKYVAQILEVLPDEVYKVQYKRGQEVENVHRSHISLASEQILNSSPDM